MEDVFKPKGQLKASKADAGGGAIRNVPVLGIVKDNIDAIRSGRLQVYIADFGGNDPDDSNQWTNVNFMSPFYGQTPATAPNTDYGSYLGNPSSYGMWYSPPDIGSTVMCIFAKGDPNSGYWIGCIPDPNALTMVPAIGAVDNVTLNSGEADSYGGATRLPVTNMNTNNDNKANSSLFLDTPKPVHSYVSSILAQQGLIRDPIRGTIGTSAQRESPSRVGWGVSTPGRPIYQGGYTDDTITNNLSDKNVEKLQLANRRGGHSIVMDDGDIAGGDQLVRIRTALGHQILMSDDGQTLFIIHSNGQSYIELGKEGTIDMYSTNSVNIRTQGDLNLHADNNININAGKDLNIASNNLNVNTQTDMNFRAGGNFSKYIQGAYTLKVDGSMSLYSSGEASLESAGTTYVTGPSAVNLNTGSASLVPQKVTPIPIIAQTDTLFDTDKGWAAAPGKLLTIVSRAPAHAPWANANQGVDVKVDNDADAALPSAPSSSVAAVNSATAGSPDVPITPSLISTVPGASAASASLDASTTASMVSAAASTAAATASSVVQSGVGTITDATGNVSAAVGSLAQTPQQLETAGILKPGSSSVINSLVQSGSNVASAMTPNLFTGQAGAQNLTALVQNTSAQVGAQVSNIQSAQAGLTQAGVITGTEAPTQIAGLVNAASSAGTAAVASFASNAGAGATSAISGLASSAGSGAGSIAGQITSGNFAAGLTSTVTGGLGSIATSLTGLAGGSSVSGLLSSALGVAGSAFSAITKSFKSFAPGVPQNLTQISEQNAASSNVADASSGSMPTASSLLSSATGAIPGASALVSSATSAVANATAGSGVGNLPGGLSAITNQASSLASTVANVPAMAGLTSLTKNASAAATTGLSVSSAASSVTAGASSALGGLASSATSALSSLTSGSGLSSALSGLGSKSLSSLVSAGLPASAGAALSAAIGALSAGGPFSVKMPTVATDTSNRSGLLSQITSVLGNSKIPSPNFSGSASSISAMQAETDRLHGLVAQQNVLLTQLDAQSSVVDNARATYISARDTLPAGDSEIASAKAVYVAELDKLSAISAKIRALADQA
jgi:hypothetical protein